MANYDVSNPQFDSRARKLESGDWAHADVLNQTIEVAVKNTVALQRSTVRRKNLTVSSKGWSEGKYAIVDSAITKKSIVEVFWNKGSKTSVVECEIDGDTEDGTVVLSCSSVPVTDLKIDLMEIRNEVTDNAV